MEYNASIVLIAIVALAVNVPLVLGCTLLDPLARSKFHNESDDQKVYYSDYVLVGTPTKNMTGDQYPFDAVKGIYTVEFFVECIYKEKETDPITEETIYVTGVGNLNGALDECPPAPLTLNIGAILYLRKLEGDVEQDNMYEIEYAPVSETEEAGLDQIVDDLTVVCDLKDQEKDHPICFEPLREQCFKYQPKTPAPETQPVTKPTVKTDKPAEPTQEPESNDTTVGKPITNNKNDTYNTQTGQSSAGETKDDPSGGASVQVLSQSVVILISVLFILV